MIAPCRGCEFRHVGCHGKCEQYKAFEEYMRVIRERRRAASEATTDIIDGMRRNRREKRQGRRNKFR